MRDNSSLRTVTGGLRIFLFLSPNPSMSSPDENDNIDYLASDHEKVISLFKPTTSIF